jgi:hypothetical protein
MRFPNSPIRLKFQQHRCSGWKYVWSSLLTLLVFCGELSAQSWTEREDVFSPPAGKVFFSPGQEISYSNRQNVCLDDPLCGQSEHPLFVFMPEGFIYPTYLSHPHEPRVGTQWVSDKEDGLLWESSLGGRFGLIRWGPAESPEGVQLDFMGGVSVRIDPRDNTNVDAMDFRLAFPITWMSGPHRFKFGYSHLSSHLGDEFLLDNPGYDRLNYVRDNLTFGYSYYSTPSIRWYGEASYALIHIVAEPWRFALGAEYAPAVPTGFRGAPFIAVNGDLREEVDFGGAVSAQAGWAWRTDLPATSLLRAGIFYYNGKSSQLSFFDQDEEQLGFGLWYDF